MIISEIMRGLEHVLKPHCKLKLRHQRGLNFQFKMQNIQYLWDNLFISLDKDPNAQLVKGRTKHRCSSYNMSNYMREFTRRALLAHFRKIRTFKRKSSYVYISFNRHPSQRLDISIKSFLIWYSLGGSCWGMTHKKWMSVCMILLK